MPGLKNKKRVQLKRLVHYVEKSYGLSTKYLILLTIIILSLFEVLNLVFCYHFTVIWRFELAILISFVSVFNYFFNENLFWLYMYILYFYFFQHAFCNKPQYHYISSLVSFCLPVPIIYQVSRVRDGKSFATRKVDAIQKGNVIFTMLASFHVFLNSTFFLTWNMIKFLFI